MSRQGLTDFEKDQWLLLRLNLLAWHFERCDSGPDCPRCGSWTNALRIVREPRLPFSDPMFTEPEPS